jgi:beta-phosphoglucomutase-like phosphatase (HAD superfamily)
VYVAAADKLGVALERAAVVEDSSNGLRAGAAAGMLVIAVPNRDFPPTDDSLALASLVVESVGELTPELIEDAAVRRG